MTIKIDIDRDKKGVSIKLESGERRAFSKFLTDENGNEILNENFEAEIDEWVGETNFIKNKVNF